ncbi:hypothetical protein NPIL_117441 [Nephila pilipes]|uniref:Uncharacterized protein n=1 Tax=Nephila pilipes TaxID=299642 RepID=A0A8X6UQ46_NEPPI|nr:hypothetical protein NPIL_117441 [Nephila pilipes]
MQNEYFTTLIHLITSVLKFKFDFFEAIPHRHQYIDELSDVETSEERDARVGKLQVPASTTRSVAAPEEGDTQRQAQHLQQSRSRTKIDLKNVVFNYYLIYNNRTHRNVVIGPMTNLCFQCHAFKFQKETPGIYRCNGKFNLTPMTDSLESLFTYMAGAIRESKHFLDTYSEIKLLLSNDIVFSDEYCEIWQFHTHIHNRKMSASSDWFTFSSTRKRSIVFVKFISWTI